MALLARSLRASAQPALVFARSMGVQYKAPIRDIQFVVDEVLNGDRHYQKAGFTDVSSDFRHSVLEEMAKFSEEVLSPLNAAGDEHGCKLDAKTKDVTTPPGWKEAYEQYKEGGWQSLSVAEEYGGQNLPLSLGLIKSELIATANWAWGMYPGLSIGAMNTLTLHGSEEQKQQYLTKLAEGTWLGTMCLTEPQCGTDLGQMKTKAVKQADGSYKITGTKIFISCGEHDFTENIVHIVLARTENAPPGTKGISLFIVPKYLQKEDGSLETKKNLVCGGLEKKMGIHGSSTCVMNFEDSKGWLIGEENKGLFQMFTFMNTARIGTALQGLGAAELAYQGALPYTKERMSMRALSGTREPEKAGDAIIHHGDVRRMLLTCKAFAEGARSMMYETSMLADYMLTAKTPEEHKKVDDEMGFLTPILKGFITEIGVEAASQGLQCFGGHGYLQDWGMEQNMRDARIGTLYEGTTGIQALDLLGRKILLQGGKNWLSYTGECFKYMKKQLWDNRQTSQHKREIVRLLPYFAKWYYMTGRVALRARSDADALSAASNDYLMYSGYTVMGFHWLRMMDVASERLANGGLSKEDELFYKAKVQTGQFYFDHLLPRANSHFQSALASHKSIMGEDAFNFQQQ
ncbi:uncharacterized protein MONBRDRAFT_37466 [Monosiga brevicollis MX1]|uniref:Acyl-CoA dehydrogenase n=1 Tax=Monosiga brevicollis TaxID=81824 RepID=A9V1X7_MONBE|nr:uncharacterized protein MONBRDRAFT_37466 [Monosiga brevicollis MX1]EDQ88641.1 predicted protein [Monosiga brevicollis MX1]|eukprot:XP_001746745.1 hypothetical protein [Monosiga brevicollis MX1]